MNFLRHPRANRILRPVITTLALGAAIWHGTHALSAIEQSNQYRASDTALSDYFWAAFQSELAVTVVGLFAAGFAWYLFRPRPPAPQG